ncbi:UNVERIFIED_CONTAM: hypothetical protein K2H54_021997 [Gekko kuhli]
MSRHAKSLTPTLNPPCTTGVQQDLATLFWETFTKGLPRICCVNAACARPRRRPVNPRTPDPEESSSPDINGKTS